MTKREHIIDVIEGIRNRHIAAAAYYLLLEREKDSYLVTNLYRTIANPLSEKEKREAILQAFEAPKLNRQLLDKFDGDEIPKELTAHLTRFFSITEDAAPIAAAVFIENAKFCGVLSDDKLNFKLAQARLDFSNGLQPDQQENENTGQEIQSNSEAQGKEAATDCGSSYFRTTEIINRNGK